MKDLNPENLSAGMDGELSREELRFLLRRLDHDQQLLATWTRFHVAADGLRHDLPALASPGFAAKVMLAIDNEVVAAGSSRRNGWLRLSAGGAIAASVAVIALMAARPTGDGVEGSLAAQHTGSAQLDSSTQASVQALPVPAAAPKWLSSKNAFRYSQQASATLDGPILGGATADSISPYAQSLSPYQVKGYRTLQSSDGSYLLLVDPTRSSARRASREAAVAQ